MQISRTNRRGFTLTELVVVLGLIAVLVSLLLPVVGRARAAAQAAACLSNIRQMGMAWTVYVSENRGRLLDYQSYNPAQPERAYRGYWTGMLDDYKVGGNAVLCPAADEPIPFKQIKGYGNVNYAWTGKYESNGSVARFKGGPFMIALHAGLPIVPITLVGSRHVMFRGEVTVRPGCVTLIVHDPVETTGVPREAAREFATTVRDIVAGSAA